MLHSVPYGRPSGDFIVEDLAPLPGEGSFRRMGQTNSFRSISSSTNIDFDLERIFSDHGIKTIITVGTQVQTAVLHTAAEAALRG